MICKLLVDLVWNRKSNLHDLISPSLSLNFYFWSNFLDKQSNRPMTISTYSNLSPIFPLLVWAYAQLQTWCLVLTIEEEVRIGSIYKNTFANYPL